MNYARALLLALVATLLLAPPALARQRIQIRSHGWRGHVAPALQLWGKANKSGTYALVIATNRRFRNLDTHSVRARKESRQHGSAAREAA